jgi:hypothetical protein
MITLEFTGGVSDPAERAIGASVFLRYVLLLIPSAGISADYVSPNNLNGSHLGIEHGGLSQGIPGHEITDYNRQNPYQ